MANNKFVTLEALKALKTAVQRAQTEWAKDIAKTGHAHFEKVEAVPDAGTAKENILYLVMNKKTQHYDIYAKVEGAVVLLDDTTVDLTGYATKEQLEAVSGGLGGTVYTVVLLDDTTVDLTGYATKEQLEAVSGGLGGTVYTATKEDLTASDESVITGYFAQHPDAKPKKGDVFVVVTTVEGSTYEQAAYFYDGSKWAAVITGYFAQHPDAKPKKGDVFVVVTTVEGSTYEQAAYFYDGSKWAAGVSIASEAEANEMIKEIFG